MIELCKPEECTGCSACYNSCGHNALSMVDDIEGFAVPKINHNLCVSCGLCVRSCPVLNPVDFSDNNVHSIAAYAKDQSIRQRGSSGGLFTVFANYILDKGGIVAGASFDESLVVEHSAIDNKEDLQKLQGSKYVQSSIGTIFKYLRLQLNQGKPVLFVGVSCQVAGLLSYLRRPYDNLYTVDIICHGVPSPLAFKKYIDYLLYVHPNLQTFNFRDLEGWNCNSNATFKANDGSIKKDYLYGYDSAYFSYFINGYMNRECCYSCRYTRPDHRIGDISLGDFWGIGKKHPYSHDKKYGVSFVSYNTEKGRNLFDAIKDKIEFEERDIQETIIEGNNHQLVRPSVRPPERTEFYNNLNKYGWDDLASFYNIKLRLRPGLKTKLIKKFKKLLSLRGK